MPEKLRPFPIFKWAGFGLCMFVFFFLFYLAVSEPDDILRLGPTILLMTWSLMWPVSYFGAKLVTLYFGNAGCLLLAPSWALATWKVSGFVTFRPDPPIEMIVMVGLSLLASTLSGWAAAQVNMQKRQLL